MTDKDEIRIGRMDECTFRQAQELSKRGWEGYSENMSQFFPLMAPAPTPPVTAESTIPTDTNLELDRFMNRLGTNGIRVGLSVVAFVGEKPAGFVFIAIRTNDGKKIACNVGTAVSPEYRGRGIAKAMMIESDRVIRDHGVDLAVLEVVTANANAISAYKAGGFQIVDQLIGYTCSEALQAPIYEGAHPVDVTLQTVKAADVGKLPFYREMVAGGCMWQATPDQPALIAYDAQGTAIGYALYNKSHDHEGVLKSVNLKQCEVSPERADREQIFRFMLNEVYGPYNEACLRKTFNLSMSNPEPVALLKEAGFERVYEQYLMIHDYTDTLISSQA